MLSGALIILASLASLAASQRIVGGEEAKPHEFPWQISLRRKSDNFHFCGGAGLNENTVVTAAHCTVIWDSPDEVVIVAGEHNKKVDEGTEQTRDVTKLTVHESYGSPKGFENDIALWSLAEPLVFDDAVAAVPLPKPMQESSGGSTPDVLMKVNVPVVADSTCKLEYPFSIADSMICAGERGKDRCQGDSGGPLVSYNADGSGYLGGIVSWGRGCAGLFSPGVYTEVSYFTEWIANNA